MPALRFPRTSPARASLPRTQRRATLRRSFDLLSSFRFEQSDPARFYGHLARDTAELLDSLRADAGYSLEDSAGGLRDGVDSPSSNPLSALREATILDIGGGPGYFAEEFERRGARYISVEPDVGEMAAAGIEVAASVRGSGMDLPFRSGAFDLVYSSNVAEHVPEPWRMGEEMLRVTAPGGLTVLSYTVWLGPFGGHETGLWPHYVGGEYARDRYARVHGHPPKNVFGTSLFNVSCAAGLRWVREVAERGEAEVVRCFPRYHPGWAWWLTRVPGLREFGVSNLVIVLRRL
ncbi:MULTISPECIES: class I SAM-dependent methyltransferase [unclassified Corynebacterium]|uniref:class I SAM-dependent methyltransferase n=1 Tax=unclassified Corynebacterium TaxID=2624378 RepID=UPI0029C9E629|nr:MULTISPECIES: class I SAM-dependent methyltransferase [unclassified Corynebacterium]WPF65999.1 class I SAM-dependent methyltransferase [Corynebacterium sp. 22KM0430]WPF68492.1 class I SAM-dependent methyltransferase [Corynebacterium sp. 21KM1197]